MMEDDTLDLENIPTNDDDVPVHDQLPSVEEAKTNLALEVAPSSRKVLKVVAALVCTAALLLIVGVGIDVASSSTVAGQGETISEEHPGYADREQEVVEFVLKKFPRSFANLKLNDTPQRKATKWIADLDKMQVSMEDEDVFLQRYALAVFHYAMNGPNWPLPLGFLSEEDVCKWYQIGFGSSNNARYVGAHCQEFTTVRELFFPEKWLEGKFPDELELLTDLRHISFYNNPGIGGKLPWVLSKLSNLNYLGLHYCKMEGTIPDWIGDMTALTSLVLSNNKLSGEIPTTIMKLSNLRQVFLDDNKLHGDIHLLKPLTNLEAVLLEDNMIEGKLDEHLLESWSKMELLDLSHNQLDSTIPNNLWAMPNLVIADFHKNSFRGTIPAVNETNNVLQFLSLQETGIKGEIPSSIHMLTKLSHLDLANNSLTGDLPGQMQRLVHLHYLFLSQNPFNEGPIPEFLRQMKKLEDLSLKDTRRNGKLPTWINELDSLVMLDIDNNKLSGMLPQTLGLMTQLQYLLINNNVFEGAVPNSLFSLTNLRMLLLERNKLIGGLENAICTRQPEIPSVFIADCGGKGRDPELACSCCSLCCQDDIPECNDVVWTGAFDPIWETRYERKIYQFEQVALHFP